MKKLAAFVFTLSLILFGAGFTWASPVSFDLAGSTGGSSVTVSDSAPWANLFAALAPGLDSQNFTLNDGETKEVDFFTLTARGAALWASYAVEATLAFDDPSIAADGSGSGHFFTLLGLLSGGTLTWDSATVPDSFIVDGNTIKVDFESGWTVVWGNTTMVHAYITNEGGSTGGPVPEPATLVLFGSGLIGLAALTRRAQ